MFEPELRAALASYDRHVVCIEKIPEDCETTLRSLLEKAIKAFATRGPELRHGIALDRHVTVILSQTDGPRPRHRPLRPAGSTRQVGECPNEPLQRSIPRQITFKLRMPSDHTSNDTSAIRPSCDRCGSDEAHPVDTGHLCADCFQLAGACCADCDDVGGEFPVSRTQEPALGTSSSHPSPAT
jgi:hypothetical protein